MIAGPGSSDDWIIALGAVSPHLRAMTWWHDLLFISDAGRVALLGAGFIALALVALVGERVRTKRARIDRVGWVPWTTIFLAAAVIGGGLLATAIPPLLQG
ncbi:hypothetical protein AAG594_03280 [Citromicrobium bathyomarinum]